MILPNLLFSLSVLVLVRGIKVASPPGQVLVFVKQQDNQITVASMPLKICGDEKKCKYTVETGKCRSQQYMSTVRDEMEKGVVSSCCQSEQESSSHNDDATREVTASSIVKVDEVPVIKEIEYIGAITKKPGGFYTVSISRPLCGAKKPQNQEPKPNAGPKPKPHKCFSSDMTVRTKSGLKRMDQVQIGDEVLVQGINDELMYEPIVWLYHMDPKQEAEFITVQTASNVLSLSTNHLIPNVPCSVDMNSSSMAILANKFSFFAQKVQRGHCLIVLENGRFKLERVRKVTQERKRGIFSPITSRGTIVVNDVYVSCYSSVENQVIQHAVHGALIQAQQLISKIWVWVFGGEHVVCYENSGIPKPLKVLLDVAQMVIPSKVFGLK